jgi:probable phosphoglycerate mutase
MTGKSILESGISIDEILSSPLIRASETARHISEITGKPMRLDQRLTEQNFGRLSRRMGLPVISENPCAWINV